MSIYVGYITTQKPTIEDLQKIAFYTPGPAVEDVLCDTQFFYGRTEDLYFAIYQIRLHDSPETHDNMYFVCDESVFGKDAPASRDYNVRLILSEFYLTFGIACYEATGFENESRRIFKIDGLDNKGVSNLMAKMARGHMGVVHNPKKKKKRK